MKERSKSIKSSKHSENEESGELSSSSSSSQSSTNSVIEKRNKKLTKKSTEEGEIDSDHEGKSIKSKSEDNSSSKLQSLRKLIDRTKNEYETAQHKLEKIERAYLKAENENNKINMKKCSKYKEKYALKVEKIKDNLKIYQAKRVKLVSECRAGLQTTNSAGISSKNIDKTMKTTQNQLNKRKQELAKEKDEVEESSKNKKQRLSPNQSKTKPNNADLSQPAKPVESITKSSEITSKTAIKLPFPVLNDTRNMEEILSMLETKRSGLMKKHDQNIQTLKMLTKKGAEKLDDKVDKLKKLDQVYESQRDKIEKQLDYIRLSLNLNSIRRRTDNNPALIIQNKHSIDQMTAQLNDMYNYMKQENMIAIKKHQELADAEAAAAEEEAAKKESLIKLTTLYDQVNNSMAAILAHIGATAHAAASYAVSNHFYASYFQSANPDGQNVPIKEIQIPVPVPIKTHLAKASTTFANLKDRISNFFITSKKQETAVQEPKLCEKGNLEKKSGLNLLISNYGDNEDDEMPEEIPVINESEKANDSSSSDSSDSGSESDLEIITTSEIKRNGKKLELFAAVN